MAIQISDDFMAFDVDEAASRFPALAFHRPRRVKFGVPGGHLGRETGPSDLIHPVGLHGRHVAILVAGERCGHVGDERVALVELVPAGGDERSTMPGRGTWYLQT